MRKATPRATNTPIPVLQFTHAHALTKSVRYTHKYDNSKILETDTCTVLYDTLHFEMPEVLVSL